MRVQSSLAFAICLSLAAACSQNTGNGPPTDPTKSYALSDVGAAVVTMHPNDVKQFTVLLSEHVSDLNQAAADAGAIVLDGGASDAGPSDAGAGNGGGVANAPIHFEFDNEDPAGAQIDHADTTTAANGTASFKLTAGAKATFKVIASWTGHPEVSPVAFSIQVVNIRKLLQIVGSAQVRVANDAQSATVTMPFSSSIGLKVQLLDQDTGNPIAGDTIAFTLPNTAPLTLSGGTNNFSVSLTTGATGNAQVFLVSSTTATTGILVTAQDSAGGGAVTYSVTVQSNASGGSCTSSAQCDPGQICVGGTCTTNSGGGSCTVGNDNGCPFGYVCVNGTCQPPANPNCDPNNPAATCPAGDTCQCVGSPGAQICQCEPACNPPCDPGQTCVIVGNTGTCVSPAGVVPDLTGIWYTRHTFSIQQALPAFVQTIQTIVRDIDQVIQGQFFTGFWSWLNAIVQAVINAYVPTWVTTIIEVLDDVGTIFSNLRSVGSMRVMPGSPTDHTLFKGTEVWTSFVFYWLPLCNGQIGGNNYTPACARFDVATTDATDPGTNGTCAGQSLPTISVQIAPFTGQIVQAGSTGPWTFNVADRRVQMKMGKLILVALNLLISYLTPYSCIEDALACSPGNTCLLDCPAFGTFIEGVTNGILPAAVAEGICDAAANVAGGLLTHFLETVTFTADTIDFAGHAVVTTDSSATADCSGGAGGPCASKLGNDNYDTDLQNKTGHQDGWWSGSFFLGAIGCTPGSTSNKCMPGAWEAERTPVQ